MSTVTSGVREKKKTHSRNRIIIGVSLVIAALVMFYVFMQQQNVAQLQNLELTYIQGKNADINLQAGQYSVSLLSPTYPVSSGTPAFQVNGSNGGFIGTWITSFTAQSNISNPFNVWIFN